MCDCGNNVVDLSHLKIYIQLWLEYKAKLSSGCSYKRWFLKLLWATESHRKKNYLMLYEDLGLT